MDYFIWDKKSNLLGLSADILFNSRPDLKYDDVIVIHKKGEPENVVMVETKNELRLTYDIDSENADVVGFITAVILANDDPETIQEKLDNIDNPKEPEPEPEMSEEEESLFMEYSKMIEDVLKKEMGLDLKDYEFEYPDDELFNLPIPMVGEYQDPECKVIDLSDADESVEDKKLTVVLKHAFIAETTNVLDMKCMDSFKEELEHLEDEREKYANESNFEMVEMLTHKIETLKLNINDSCDATLEIQANKVYQYEENVIVECTNGQSIILQQEVIDTIKTNAIAYNKRKTDNEETYKVHYKTVEINLNECYNEVIERNNTLFVVAI